jgi:Sec-independent protein translocase protein TatA
MNIFGIGEVELVLIILIALIVAGPKRMIQWMYVLGRWTARLRKMWSDASEMIQKEVNEAGLDIEIPKELPNRNNIRQAAAKALKPFSEPVKEAVDEVRTVGKELDSTVKQTRESVRGVQNDVRNAGRQLKTPASTPVTSNGSVANGTSSNGTTSNGAGNTPSTRTTNTPTDQDASDSAFGTWSGNKE